MSVPEHHTAAGWAIRPRSLEGFTVTAVVDNGDSLTITGDHGWTFGRSKTSLGRDISVGDELWIETMQLTRITGLRDRDGWLFRLSDQDLADEAIKFSADLERDRTIELEKNMKEYAQWEADLPDWLRARIQVFRDAAGEKFLRDGWGYELVICRLAACFDANDEAGAEVLSSELGVSGNQWDYAKALAAGRKQHGDGFAAAVPAGLSPITGSADYS